MTLNATRHLQNLTDATDPSLPPTLESVASLAYLLVGNRCPRAELNGVRIAPTLMRTGAEVG